MQQEAVGFGSNKRRRAAVGFGGWKYIRLAAGSSVQRIIVSRGQ